MTVEKTAVPTEYGAAQRILSGLRDARWLNRDRVAAYSRVGCVMLALTLLGLILWTHHRLPTEALGFGKSKPFTTDFSSFYAAGDLARRGTPALVYDQNVHWRIEQEDTEKGIDYYAFYYPPIFLLLCRPLAELPYLVAFVVWIGATLAFFLAVLRPLLPGYAFPLTVLASPTVMLALASGQNSFLTAGLFGAALAVLDKRPWLAGCLFGCIAYKPHFGILIPVALLAGGRWRSVVAAALTVAGLALASLWAFGLATWQAYFAINAIAARTFEEGLVAFWQNASAFAAVRMLGGGVALAYAVQAGFALGAAAIVWRVWRRTGDTGGRAMSLTLATPLVPPVFLGYDLVIGGVGLAWWAKQGRETGFLPWEKLAILLAVSISTFSAMSAKLLHVSLTPLAMIVLLGLAYRRIRSAQPAPAVANAVASVNPRMA